MVEMDITVFLVIAAVLLALGAWLAFVWAARSGQFRDVEKIKYRVLKNELEDSERESGNERE
jgi:cbb3-type cytochrome oxidase maturation protein